MVTKKEIKTITVKGHNYDYIESATKNGVIYFTTTFIQFQIPKNYSEAFENVGGYTREMLYTQMKDLDVNMMTIISTVTENGLHATYFLFEKDNVEVERVVSVEEVFLPHAIDYLIEHKDIVGEIKIENSLNYIEDEKYGKYMEKYEQPKNVNQSGLKLGKEDILFGEKFIIRGLNKVKHMLDGQFLQVVEEEGLDALQVNVLNKIGAFDIVSSEYLLKANGEVYTVFDSLRFSMNKDKVMSDEEIFEAEVIDELEGVHKRIAKHMDKLKSSEYCTDEQLEEELQNFKKRIDYVGREKRIRESLEKALNEPFTLLFDRRGLNTLLSCPELTVEKLV